ncbi:glutathione S-transferase II [Phaeosphaeriaceae sp. PMI808]|nr:glutathione S-transferase II [Phaeosphaeriaceae sp. PMI808]
MSTKPIRVWLAPPGPNPWKQVPYEITSIKFQDIKVKPFIDLNPNGRVPAIEDPNTGLILWETGAIILYLVEQYDIAKKLTYNTIQENSYIQQWLMFQVSGQGPYYGQASWFNVLHSEKLPSAINRYVEEAKRICDVLENSLVGKAWLVGNKMTIADLAPSWIKAMEIRAKLMDEQGLMWNGMPKNISNMEEYQSTIKVEEDAKAI